VKQHLIRRAASILFWLVVIVYFLPICIPESLLTTAIERAVLRATGRNLTIDGGAEFWLLPWPSVRISKIALSNASWGGDQPFASADELRLTPRLLPLLRGRFEIATLKIDAPTINLMTDERGRGNWIFEKNTATAAPAMPPQPSNTTESPLAPIAKGETASVPPPAARPEAVAPVVVGSPPSVALPARGSGVFGIDRVAIHHGSIHYGSGFAAEDVAIDFSWPAPQSPLVLHSTMTIKHSRWVMDARIANPATLQSGEGSPISAQATDGEAHLTLEASAGLGLEPRGSGDIALIIPAIWLSRNSASALGGNVAVALHIQYASHHLSIDGLKIENGLIPLDISGQLIADLAVAPPKIEFSLQIGTLSLDSFLPPLRPFGESAVPPTITAVTVPASESPSRREWHTSPLKFGVLKGLDIEATISANRIVVYGNPIGPGKLLVSLQHAVVTATLPPISVGGGEVSLAASLDASEGQEVKAKVDFTAHQVAIDGFREAERSLVRGGTFNVEAHLTTRGGNERGLVDELTGSGRIELSAGSIEFYRLIGKLGGAFGTCPSIVELVEAAGDATVSHGHIVLDNVNIKTPSLRIGASGSVDLAGKQLEIQLSGSPSTCIRRSTLRGPFNALIATPLNSSIQ